MPTKPKRIQRKRTKGWKMPPNTVCVTRPGKFGNPFLIGGWYLLGKKGGGMVYLQDFGPWLPEGERRPAGPGYIHIETPEQAVETFREMRLRFPLNDVDKEVLCGKDLACWCKLSDPCHADVLLEIANG